MSIITVVCLLLSSFMQFDAVLTSPTGYMCHVHEFVSLLQFKKEMLDLNSSHLSSFCEDFGKYPSPKMLSWNKTSSDCCRWDGVKCHVINGHIIGLDLSCSGLKGFILENSSLFHLSHLQKLNLAHNDFSFSKVPTNICRLSRLAQLNLSGCDFHGIIPSGLSHISKLVLLDLSGNGNLYFSPGQFLILLRNLSHLRVLSLNYVNILTIFPANWSFSSLTYLDLEYTGVRGTLPKSIFHLPRLLKLVLHGNRNLSVTLPKNNSSNTSSLRILNLSITNFTADGFADSINSFTLLKSLSLSDCQLTGSFPNSIANLTQIVELDLSLNGFTSDFSQVISNLPAKLAKLNLNWNSFTGQFPSYILNITELHLCHNFLYGNLPFTMSARPKLRILDLSDNSFDGHIPFWLFSSPSLTLLDLGTNYLTGQIMEFTAKSLVQIDLSSNNLSGSIDFSAFKHLTKLENLKLSHNKLLFKIEDKSNVSFPDLLHLGLSSCQITKFPSLLINSKNLIFLDLSINRLIGEIPYVIPRYSLSYLNLSQNSFSGLGSFSTLCFPGSLENLPIVKSLQYLDLSSNKFEELLPLSICSFKYLYILDLSHNNFMGTIPECYGGFSSNLQVLNLQKNNLEGITSMKFPKDNGLIYLNLKENSLQGTLPGSLGNCKYLEVLDVGNNRIKDAFPNMENLTHLQVLILKSNRFFGCLSSFKRKNFPPNLLVLDISCNDFNGALTVEFLKSFRAMTTMDKIAEEARYLKIYRVPESQLYRYPISFTMKGGVFQFNGKLTTLVAIDLSSNHFVGKIPENIGNLNSLIVLNLSHNNFSGPMPSAIGELRFLESLDLSSNVFEGMIPYQLVNLTFLEILNISQNHFVGSIPQGKQFNTFLSDSYSGNLGLCGFPLTIKCAESSPPMYPLQVSLHQDDKDSCFWCELTWKTLVIAYIFGLVFGCFLFLVGKP